MTLVTFEGKFWFDRRVCLVVERWALIEHGTSISFAQMLSNQLRSNIAGTRKEVSQ